MRLKLKSKLPLTFCAAALLLSGGGALVTASSEPAAVAPRQASAAQKPAKPAPAQKPAVKVSEIAEDGLKAVREGSAKAGRVLLVNFWATWCGPCREEFPDLVKIREQYPAEHLDLVLVSLDDVSEIGTTVPEFLAQMKAGGMPSFLLNSNDPDAAINLFDPEWRGELPATFVYDPGGTLAYKHRGRIKPQEVRAAIDRALGPVARPRGAKMTGTPEQASPAQGAAQPVTQPATQAATRPAIQATVQSSARPGESAAQAGGLEQLLAYDSGAPLDLKVVGTERRDGAVVEDVTFRGVGETLQAYVVRPEAGAGPFAGVLFVHWFEPSSPTSNRTQFLEEARELARRGTASLLVSTFWSDPARYKARRWQTDFDNSVTQARNLRRALDVLVSLPGVDASRVGLVGHDYGAMFGALVAAADSRPKAYALIAGTSRFADWYLFGSSTGVPTGEDLTRFREQLSRIDPVTALGRARGSFFLQFGERDKYTPRDNFLAFYAAAPEPKRIATYASGHDMSAPVIRHDRAVWLAEQLGLN